MGEREDWLATRHAAWETPRALVDAAVQEATGARISLLERVIAGEANETYLVTTAVEQRVVVKISHILRNGEQFARMHEASESLLAAGILVPRVLLRTHTEFDGTNHPLVVQTFIEGTPMLRAMRAADAETALRWTVEAGELLARIHATPVDVAPLPAGQTLGTRMIDDAVGRIAFVGPTLRARGIDADAIREQLVSHRGVLDAFPPCREHGDYGADHIIIREGRVVGVIDLDCTSVGTAITDIAWWDTYFDTEPHPSRALLAGYRAGWDPGVVDEARWVFGLARSIEHLQYFEENDDPSGRAHILRLIEQRARQVAAIG